MELQLPKILPTQSTRIFWRVPPKPSGDHIHPSTHSIRCITSWKCVCRQCMSNCFDHCVPTSPQQAFTSQTFQSCFQLLLKELEIFYLAARIEKGSPRYLASFWTLFICSSCYGSLIVSLWTHLTKINPQIYFDLSTVHLQCYFPLSPQ